MTERDFCIWGSFAAFFLLLAAEMLLLRVRARVAREAQEGRA